MHHQNRLLPLLPLFYSSWSLSSSLPTSSLPSLSSSSSVSVISMHNNRHVKLCYEMLRFYDNLGFCNWVSDVRKCLYSNGFVYIWEHVDNQSLFIVNFVQRLNDHYTQYWAEKCSNASKLCHYKHFK